MRFEKNCDLRKSRDAFRLVRAPSDRWVDWTVGIAGGLALLYIMARNDTAADLIEEIAMADPRLSTLIEQTRCPVAAAPLEKMVITIGTQADGKTPTVDCVYVTAPLGGNIPQFRYVRPMIAELSTGEIK